MKRIITVMLTLLIVCSFLFADTVRYSAEGSGETLEKAKEEAKINLAEIVFPSLVSSETLIMTADGSTKKSYSSSFERKSNSTVIGEFPGLEYSNIRQKNGLYTVTTEIIGDEKTLQYYSLKILSEKANVEELYEKYLSLSNSSTTEKREMLSYVLGYYNNYVSYKNIYIKLGGGLRSSFELNSVPSKAVLLTNYQSLLDEEANELTMRTTVSSINKEIESRLAENEKAREEYNKSLENMKAQEKLQKELELQAALSRAFDSSDSENVGAEEHSSYGLESFKSYLEAIGTYDDNLVEVCQTYEAMRFEWKTSIYKSFEEESSAIWARTYPIAQCGLDGKPTQNAKALRVDEVNALKKDKELELEEVYKEIDEKFKNEIQKRYNLLIEAIKSLEEKEFTLYSKNGDFSVNMYSPYYDGENFSWYLNMELPYPISSNITKIPLSYSSLTGNKIPSDETALKELLTDVTYITTVETYTDYLDRGNYDCSLSFTVRVDEEKGSVKLNLSPLKIPSPDGKTISIGLSSSIITSLDGENIPFIKNNALYLEKKIDSVSYYESYDFLKIKERPKEKEPFKITFKTGVMYDMSIGSAFDTRVGLGVGGSIVFQLFLGKHFFLSGSFTFSMLFSKAMLEVENSPCAVQGAVLPGVGIMLGDNLGILIEAGVIKKNECILSPSAMYIVNNMPLFLSFGADVNLSTKKASFSFGVGGIIPNL